MSNSWVCCHLDNSDTFELCRIQKQVIKDVNQHTTMYVYSVITYYDGKELFSGTAKQCRKWIDEHYVNRRYLDCYEAD